MIRRSYVRKLNLFRDNVSADPFLHLLCCRFVAEQPHFLPEPDDFNPIDDPPLFRREYRGDGDPGLATPEIIRGDPMDQIERILSPEEHRSEQLSWKHSAHFANPCRYGINAHGLVHARGLSSC